MAHDVFISYSSRNKPVADAICAGLEAERLRCWIAPRDVLPGQNYGESIVHAIAGCRVMVLIFSEATNVSQAVIREAERAMHNSKPIIPFRIEDTPMSPGLEFFLASCHWLDAIHPPMDAHIAHLARSVKALIGEGAIDVERPFPAPAVPAPQAKSHKISWIIAAASLLLLACGWIAWIKARKPVPAAPVAAGGLTLSTSLAGAGTGSISAHFASGASSPLRYESSETDGVLKIQPANAPAPGRTTVISPAGDRGWLDVPTVELDLKLLNGGTTTAFFHRAVFDVTSSTPEKNPAWLIDGTRLPKALDFRQLGGPEEMIPSLALGIAGPEEAIDFAKLPDSAAANSAKTGGWTFPLPRPPRPGIEETLFGRLTLPDAETTFEIPVTATPAAKSKQDPKDPEPLYTVQLRETGENYSAACELSQYIQAGQGDRFFLRLDSPSIARHRFTVTLEYDDGSSETKRLKGPVVDANLFPTR